MDCCRKYITRLMVQITARFYYVHDVATLMLGDMGYTIGIVELLWHVFFVPIRKVNLRDYLSIPIQKDACEFTGG